MSYRLEDNQTNILINGFESFLVRLEFNINKDTSQISVTGGGAAIYQSRTTVEDFPQSLFSPDLQTLRLIDNGQRSQATELGMDLEAVWEETLDLSNETGRLTVLTAPQTVAGKNPAWLRVSKWNIPYVAPSTCRDHTPLRPRWFTFDTIQQRFCVALQESSDAAGCNTVRLACPMLNPLIMSSIYSHHSKDLVAVGSFKLNLSAGVGWEYPPNSNTPIPGSIKGSVTAVQGAFKRLPLSGLGDFNGRWFGAGGQGGRLDPQEVAARLQSILGADGRNVETCDDTTQNTVVAPSPDPPVEILILENLNSGGNEVARVHP